MRKVGFFGFPFLSPHNFVSTQKEPFTFSIVLLVRGNEGGKPQFSDFGEFTGHAKNTKNNNTKNKYILLYSDSFLHGGHVQKCK